MNENLYVVDRINNSINNSINNTDEEFMSSKKSLLYIKNMLLEDSSLFSMAIENDQSQQFEPLFLKSPFKKNNSLDKYLFRFISAQRSQKRIDEIVKEQAEILVSELKKFSMDTEELSSAEQKILDIEEQFSFRILGEVLQNIYVQYNDYPNILAGICRGLERFDLSEVMPWGPTMLSGLLSHKNEMVKEYAVSLVENWAEVDLLPVLRNLDCSSLWLKEYVSDVVKYLEECEKNVLYKEII